MASTGNDVHRRRLTRIAGALLRYGLVLLILWIGIFKFTPTEARAIEPLLQHSPLLSWLLAAAGTLRASQLIGSAEIVIAILLALRPVAARLSLLGSFAAIGMFLTTLSFLITTPNSWTVVDGLLIPAGGGFFILKDVVLLGAALWTAADALAAPTPTRT
jgi:reactive chlorine resistance protein C